MSMPLGTDFASAHSRASLAALAAFLITSGGVAQIAAAPDAATLAKFDANKNRISAFSMELLKAPIAAAAVQHHASPHATQAGQ